jgi:CHAT domain-containing protein
VGEEETQLFVVTPGRDLAVKTLPVGEEALRQEVTHLRQLVEQVRSRSGLGAGGLDWTSRHLYQMLVHPAEPWIAAGARILIVPDGPLHLLPFAALIRDTGAKKGGRDWQYLIERKPIHVALSGTVYAELKERRRNGSAATSSTQWVGFGDPWFPPRLAQARPQETGETRLRSFSTRTGLHWQRLPESRREVERIAAFFPKAVRRVYVDREATEEQAKALGREARIVHFATHGFVDDRSPFDSGLVLAIPEQFTPGRDNGLLQVWEIFESVRLDADLVVLSACETGLGEIRGGEGIIGLTRAFQYAGARSVLASLWRVDDRATAELMERFYRHLRAGEPKDAALRSAQLELIAGFVKLRAPYFWAAMQLYGNGL